MEQFDLAAAFDDDIAETMAILGVKPRTREWTAARIREAAKAFAGETLNCAEFCRRTGIPRSRVYGEFAGWEELASLAGITPKPGGRTPATYEEIIRDILIVWRRKGSFPTGGEYQRHGSFSVSHIYNRIGKWTEVRDQIQKAFPNGPPDLSGETKTSD